MSISGSEGEAPVDAPSPGLVLGRKKTPPRDDGVQRNLGGRGNAGGSASGQPGPSPPGGGTPFPRRETRGRHRPETLEARPMTTRTPGVRLGAPPLRDAHGPSRTGGRFCLETGYHSAMSRRSVRSMWPCDPTIIGPNAPDSKGT